jgi:hypothetical protein
MYTKSFKAIAKYTIRHNNRDIVSQDAMNNNNALTLQSDSSNIEIVKVDPEKALGTFVEYFHCHSQIHGHALQRL